MSLVHSVVIVNDLGEQALQLTIIYIYIYIYILIRKLEHCMIRDIELEQEYTLLLTNIQ